MTQQALFAEPDSQIKVSPSDVLALASVKGLGFNGIRRLTNFYRDLSKVWCDNPHNIEGVLHSVKLTAATRVADTIAHRAADLQTHGAEELERIRERDTCLITISSEAFPKELGRVENPPYWLFMEGDERALDALNRIALVGTRSPTVTGTKAAERMASWLVRRNMTIVAGLAEGIDAVGHQAAVDCGRPTIAVLGHGIDVAFPASTIPLRRGIVEAGGVVLTEYLPSERYDRGKFIQRNRLIAGLSRAVIVVDAEYSSGTAHTVRFAAQYGIPIVGGRLNGYQPSVFSLLDELGATIVDIGTPGEDTSLAIALAEALGHAVPEEPTLAEPDATTRVLARIMQILGSTGGPDEIDVERLLRELRLQLTQKANPRDN